MKKKEEEIKISCTSCTNYFNCSTSSAVVDNKKRDKLLMKLAMAHEMNLIAIDCKRYNQNKDITLFKTKDKNGISGIQKKKDNEHSQYGLEF